MWLGQQRCDNFGDNCVSNGLDQYVDLFRSIEFQNALGVTIKFALHHGAARRGLRRRPRRARRQVPARDRRVPLRVLLDGRHLGRRGQPDVAVPAAASIGALANIGWFNSIFPSSRIPGCCRTPARRCSPSALSSVWANLGFTFILVTAGLQSIPRDLHEAAAVDGAGGIRRFWTITLPMLGPTLLFVLIVADDPRVPGLRRDRPADRRRPAARQPDHDDHVPHLRPELADPQRRRAAGRRRPCCCSSLLLVLSASSSPASDGGCTMSDLTASIDGPLDPTDRRRRRSARPREPGSGLRRTGRLAPMGPLPAARGRDGDRPVPDLHDGHRRR